MQSIKREYHNTKYVAENCNDLHCLQNDDTPYGREITSTWELDARDRELIASGGNICLTFVGERQPPCRVESEVDFLNRYNNQQLKENEKMESNASIHHMRFLIKNCKEVIELNEKEIDELTKKAAKYDEKMEEYDKKKESIRSDIEKLVQHDLREACDILNTRINQIFHTIADIRSSRDKTLKEIDSLMDSVCDNKHRIDVLSKAIVTLEGLNNA